MYHCHLYVAFVGQRGLSFEVIEGMDPPEDFTYEFFHAEGGGGPELAGADVIIADLTGIEPVPVVESLLRTKKEGARLLVLADRKRADALGRLLPALDELWLLPMGAQELRFRFGRWQEQRKAEADAWLIRQYLETTINSVPNLIWYKDKEGIHRKVNDSFCRLVGKSKTQVEGRDHCFIWGVGPEDAEVCAASDRVVMETEKTVVAEEEVVSSGGTKLLTTYKSPLYDLDGSVMGTVGVGIDITQERAYEEELVGKNNTLETIFTTLECGVLCHSADGHRILSVNDAALKILGYDTKEDMAQDGFDLVAMSVLDEDKPKLRAAIQSLQREGDSVNIEYRVRHGDGELLHIMGNVKLIRENGELCYQRFLLDWTAQKLRELERERHQDELVQALSIDYNLVCHFDLDTGKGLPLRVSGKDNLALDAIFHDELDLETCMEAYVRQFVCPEDREMMRQALSAETLRTELEKKKLYYVTFRRAEGEQKVYYSMKVVRGDHWGENHGIVLGFRSVDEETRKERERRRALEDVLDQARRASQAKDMFLSNMSHDIRTPMNAIMGFTNLSLAHLDDKEQVEEYLKKIMSSSNHMLSLLNDILDMSHIESGRMRLEQAPHSLVKVLRELKGIVQGELTGRELTFTATTDGIRNEMVLCDKVRLDQVLLNILSNAIKYTEPGGSISAQVTERAGIDPEHREYEFKIRDTGIGMDEKFLAHIFEPFEREANTTASGIQGTGLGLAITKNIVEMMDGSIDIQSEKGVGTEVTVTIPLRLYRGEGDAALDELPQHTDHQLEGHQGRILLTEDNLLNQEIAQAILEDAGFLVDLAENGSRAVEMVSRSTPGYYRVILMDIQMPVMNGYEATRAIRALPDPQLSQIPILAMTANAFEKDKQEALRSGMNGHVAKPIDIDKFFEVLEELLEK